MRLGSFSLGSSSQGPFGILPFAFLGILPFAPAQPSPRCVFRARRATRAALPRLSRARAASRPRRTLRPVPRARAAVQRASRVRRERRRVCACAPPPPPVLSGHVSSFPPYQADTSRPFLRTKRTRAPRGVSRCRPLVTGRQRGARWRLLVRRAARGRFRATPTACPPLGAQLRPTAAKRRRAGRCRFAVAQSRLGFVRCTPRSAPTLPC